MEPKSLSNAVVRPEVPVEPPGELRGNASAPAGDVRKCWGAIGRPGGTLGRTVGPFALVTLVSDAEQNPDRSVHSLTVRVSRARPPYDISLHGGQVQIPVLCLQPLFPQSVVRSLPHPGRLLGKRFMNGGAAAEMATNPLRLRYSPHSRVLVMALIAEVIAGPTTEAPPAMR